MTIHELLAAKRDGRRHGAEELTWLAHAAANPTGLGVEPYQLSAWLMAAYIHGLDRDETRDLTLAMAQSGERVDLTGLPKPWVDKHSTGGVGDKTTIALLPILAACGLTVVKMSGRGLGITGGTVDKLASIPGFRLDLSPEEMKAQAGRIGLAITGQTPNLAPADKTLYALRDATETVASIPLIVSSILSKKIAGGAEVLGLDVKCGSGAFMQTLEEARELGTWLRDIGTACGLSVHVSITDMDQPLGRAAGNALEVREALGLLQPHADGGRFGELVFYLAAETLAAVGKASSLNEGIALAKDAWDSGAALKKARKWIEAQGGDPSVVDDPARLAVAPVAATVKARTAGYVRRLDAGLVGHAVVELGGGRLSIDDDIDLTVGVESLADVGQYVSAGQTVFAVYSGDRDRAERAAAQLEAAVEVTDNPVERRPVVMERLA